KSCAKGRRSDAFDQHDLAVGHLPADGGGALVFGRVIAIVRRLQRFELNDDVARTALALRLLVAAAARQNPGAILVEGDFRGRHIILVAFRITYSDAGDPVSLGHSFSPPFHSASGGRGPSGDAELKLRASLPVSPRLQPCDRLLPRSGALRPDGWNRYESPRLALPRVVGRHVQRRPGGCRASPRQDPGRRSCARRRPPRQNRLFR